MIKHYIFVLVGLVLLLACNLPTASEQAALTATPVPPTATPTTATLAPELNGEITVNAVQVTGEAVRFGGTSTLPEGTCLQTQLFADSVPVIWWPLNTCVPVEGGAWAIEVPLGEGDAPASLESEAGYTLRAWAFDDPGIQSETFWLEISPPPAPPEALPPTGLLPQPPITPPPPDWEPTRLPPFDPDSDAPEERARAYLRLVTDMLNASESVDAVLMQLANWMTQDSTYADRLPPNAWAEVHDFDADGADEWLISVPVQDSGCGAAFCPGYVFLAERRDSLFIPRHQITATTYAWDLGQPALLKFSDVNADGYDEIVIEQENCGAHTCYTGIVIGRWDGTRWHDLAAEPIEQAYTDYTMADEDGDGIEEITMVGGMAGSVGAGLQRPHTLVFDWQDGAYRRVSDEPEPSEHPYFQMLDANAALAAGEWDHALELAQSVLDHRALNFDELPWLVERDWTRILGYSAIEAMLVHAHHGDVLAMEEVMADLLGRDVITEANPYREGAAELLATYEATGDAVAACQAMEAALLAYDPTELAFFEWYGYNTERLSGDQLCPLDAPVEGSPEL